MGGPNQIETEWYQDGLRFECTMCGRCCTGPPGYVWVTDDEISALATLVGMARHAFADTYTRPLAGRTSLTEVETRHGFDCVFLKRDEATGTATCSVYEARPQQCRTWPFWPENLTSERAWKQAGRVCPGLGSGPVVPIEQIRIQREKTPK
ncbi:MAG: YkgJ family cysteine cluster protein [Planctomycetes bacterium]|nr:YkgJ family cysteine cluster protein [Planctomycetota bacterium]NOG53871.1 YkgJ family cysteine cluster protein [Planctomycetota bacterium]